MRGGQHTIIISYWRQLARVAECDYVDMMGEKYVKTRQFATKSKGAQEAHEAIRPTYISNEQIEASAQEQKLYELIWKRTIASQMADAELEKTTATITISNSSETFIAVGEVVTFDGFLRVYRESYDDDNEQETESRLLLSAIFFTSNKFSQLKRVYPLFSQYITNLLNLLRVI